MARDRLLGPEKAAIFLFSLGEELASSIIKQLDEDEIKKLGSTLSKTPSISQQALESVFAEFHEIASSESSLQIGDQGTQFIRNVLTKGMVDKGRAQTLSKEIQEEANLDLFHKIRRLDPKTISGFIKGEHPQTVAIILAHLDSSHAAGILQELPPPMQTEVVRRIAELETISPGVMEDIDQAIQEEVAVLKGGESQKRGGVQVVAEILNQVDGATEGSILKDLEEQQQSMAEAIRRLMFVFEDLINVDDRSIMAILKEINNEQLMTALKTASEELRTKIFKNMSERAGQMLKEDLEAMGPVRLKDVEEAQQAIIMIAKKLEAEGKIVLTGKGKEDALV